jgi:hypothetical protein
VDQLVLEPQQVEHAQKMLGMLHVKNDPLHVSRSAQLGGFSSVHSLPVPQMLGVKRLKTLLQPLLVQSTAFHIQKYTPWPCCVTSSCCRPST